MRYLTIIAYLYYSNFKEWSDLSCVHSATGWQRKATEHPDSLLPSNVWVKICSPNLIAQMTIPWAAERRLWGEGWGSNMRPGVLSEHPKGKPEIIASSWFSTGVWGSLIKGKITAALSQFFFSPVAGRIGSFAIILHEYTSVCFPLSWTPGDFMDSCTGTFAPGFFWDVFQLPM